MDNYKSGIYGLAVGDALGVPMEFMNRQVVKNYNYENMLGYGTHNQKEGTWSDDTSMTLATLDAIGERQKINLKVIMENFSKWYNNGEFAIDNNLFDIGGTTARAITNFSKFNMSIYECGERKETSNGNGSLMRILPVCIYLVENDYSDNMAEIIIADVSALTHAHAISMKSCIIYYYIVKEIIKGKGKLFDMIENGCSNWVNKQPLKSFDTFYRLLDLKALKGQDKAYISGSGYVVDTLIASIWCLMTTDTYADAVLKAISLGDDTDTTAAVTGGLAGLYYGYNNIPEMWIEKLRGKDIIDNCINKVY